MLCPSLACDGPGARAPEEAYRPRRWGPPAGRAGRSAPCARGPAPAHARQPRRRHERRRLRAGRQECGTGARAEAAQDGAGATAGGPRGALARRGDAPGPRPALAPASRAGGGAAMAQEQRRALLELLQRPGNARCADCGAPGGCGPWCVRPGRGALVWGVPAWMPAPGTGGGAAAPAWLVPLGWGAGPRVHLRGGRGQPAAPPDNGCSAPPLPRSPPRAACLAVTRGLPP